MVYQNRRYGSKSQSLVATKVSITEKGSNESSKVGGTTEDDDKSSSRNTFHVENSGEIDQKVA